MKKASAVLMALSLLLLSGCRWFRTQSEKPYTAFFDDTFLAECQLDDLPIPPTDDRRCYDHKLYFNLSDAEFESYADTIVTYLLENENIYYQGYHYQTGCPGGIFEYGSSLKRGTLKQKLNPPLLNDTVCLSS